MSRRGSIAGALIALGAAIWPAGAFAADPVQLTASFDRGARLGAATALHAELSVDGRRVPSPVTSIRVLYPKSLGLVSSGLGLAACVPPARDFEEVVIVGGPGLGGCPPNAVMGYGTATAEVRLTDGQVIPEFATLTLLSGTIEDGKLGLVIYIDGQRPFGARIVLAGAVGEASSPFGGALAVQFPSVPDLNGVVVALVRLRLAIGSSAITYYERSGGGMVAYHPDGIVLPRRCPKHGFRFRAQLGFQDGGRATADATVRCTALARAAG